MAEAHFLRMKRRQIEDGSWLAELVGAWSRGKAGVILLEPEASGDPELKQAIETMLESNGAYESGNRAVIHTRPTALAMGCETALLLRQRGIPSTVVLGMTSLGAEVNQLLSAAHAAAASGDTLPAPAQKSADAPAFDPATADPVILEGVVACYRELLRPIKEEGRGHWIVPIGTAPDPDSAHVPGVDFFMKVAGKALAPIGQLRVDGRIRSHDIWLNPSPLDITRLNEDLPADRHWTLEEWRSLIFRSMAVSADELHRLALDIEAVELTVHAAVKGGRLHYAREDGTDFSYEVKGRPVILDCGRVGTNSLGNTTAYESRITNQPTTEVFVAPIEDSLSGVIVYTVPERTVHGVIRAPYRIEIRNGQVADVRAPDEESLRILRNYTGLEPYDGKALAGTEREAFEMRRIIA